MKTEKEIRAKLKMIKEIPNDGFIEATNKAGHWEDCLDWVLGNDN
jgi:hypothetical protein